MSFTIFDYLRICKSHFVKSLLDSFEKKLNSQVVKKIFVLSKSY